jgi:uncharacterized membrane protein
VSAGDVVGLVGAFFAGLLAGEEFVIRFGVRGPLASLPDGTHILVRQALIRTLRVLVPSLYLVTLLTTLATTFLDGARYLPVRAAGMVALVMWMALTLGGTVPINAAAIDWDAHAPPANWRSQVDRWERLNTFRTAAALAAFGLLLASVTLTAAAR